MNIIKSKDMNIIVKKITKAILDGKKTYKGVKLPPRQTAGTTTQCVSYARMCAQRIYENHFRG